ncbi:hypothetical protein, partial [Burkholderia gladioli]|uniref:hypothetical protein n=1 Tax=Burkholderia gladioli TaxID=28095 RepID=UPI0026594590
MIIFDIDTACVALEGIGSRRLAYPFTHAIRDGRAHHPARPPHSRGDARPRKPPWIRTAPASARAT